MEEKVFYEDNYVKVTSARFISGKKTYAMRNISSVQLGKISPKRGFPIFLIVVGIIMLFFIDTQYYAIAPIVLGLLILILQKALYTVRVSSTSGEVDAFSSKDRNLIVKIVKAVNDSIIEM